MASFILANISTDINSNMSTDSFSIKDSYRRTNKNTPPRAYFYWFNGMLYRWLQKKSKLSIVLTTLGVFVLAAAVMFSGLYLHDYLTKSEESENAASDINTAPLYDKQDSTDEDNRDEPQSRPWSTVLAGLRILSSYSFPSP